MSAGINATNGDNSEMPGGYESWPAPAARKAPFPATGRTPFPDIPSTSRIPPSRGPMVPKKRPVRVRSHRRRSPIPKIVIEQGHRCHSSWGRDRIITIPLDRRPTLGLRDVISKLNEYRVVDVENIDTSAVNTNMIIHHRHNNNNQ